MTNMTPEEFYKANIDRENEYVRVYPAYEVKAGIPAGRKKIVPEQDGYIFTRDRDEEIMSNAEFAAKTASAQDLDLPLPRKDLNAETCDSIRPIGKGEIFHFNGINVMDHDGFIVKLKEAPMPGFMTNIQLTSAFNYAGEKCQSEKETLVTLNDEAPVKGVIADRDIVLETPTGFLSLCRGDILYPDAAAESGYSVIQGISQTQLRLPVHKPSAEEIAAEYHKTAVENLDKLKAHAPRIRVK
jgi:hypothetical protein